MSTMVFSDDREDFVKNESIDDYYKIFKPFIKKIPTLEQALLQMARSRSNYIQDIGLYVKDVIINCTDYVEKNLQKIKKVYSEINKEEAIIITSYTYECSDNEEFLDNAPYRILNQNLVSENRLVGINNVSMYLFIFLKAIRKLPKYIPKTKKKNKLYRAITRLVDQKPDPNNLKFIPYCEGCIKTFYAFTSTTPDRNIAINFLNGVKMKEISKSKKIKEIKEGTIFKLCFKELNAYDIKYLIILENMKYY